MVVLAIAIERVVLRPMVNQAPIILFMATIGIFYFLDGFGQLLWGSDIKILDIGIPKNPIFLLEGVFEGGILVNAFDLIAAAVGAVLVAVLAIFFHKTRIGRALRAVADDHQAALSVGIPLKVIWAIVWSVAGIVALVAGIMWGGKLGVQFSLALIAFKALPVLILGGFTSIPGAIVGGLIIGAGEQVAEIFLGPIIGGAIQDWFAYMLAMVFLLFRPQGLFGEKIIERSRRKCSIAKPASSNRPMPPTNLCSRSCRTRSACWSSWASPSSSCPSSPATISSVPSWCRSWSSRWRRSASTS